MTRETIGLTAYRLIFNDGCIFEMQSCALIDVLQRCNGEKPYAVVVLDGTAKQIDPESIEIIWSKIEKKSPALQEGL
jgi:hypothetical protein